MTDESSFVEELTDKSDDYARWYVEVVLKAQLADYAPEQLSGFMVIRPYGYAVWEHIQRILDSKIKETDVENAYFPMLIPESFFTREAEHVEGFVPEVAWVTHGGKKELPERLAVRPTSEAIIGEMFHRWLHSYRELPLLINQWANVLRWEKRTRFFLRTAEFLWQEGHTVHATPEEAQERTMQMLEVYRSFAEEDLAIPVITGEKTPSERFPGADNTYSIEAMMGNGWALQAGTSHNLGQHFSRAFDIGFLDANNQRQLGWTTSWGMSTRIIGALIMVHGDDNGLIMPPKVAPVQAIIVPIWRKEAERVAVIEMVDRVEKLLRAAGVRVKSDRTDNNTPGWKFNEYELRGVPLRIEIGPRDVQNGQVVVVRRDNRVKEGVPVEGLAERIPVLLTQFQADMFARALKFRADNTHRIEDYESFKDIIANKKGFISTFWCGDAECEAAIKQETRATTRNIPLQQEVEKGSCVRCGKPSQSQGRIIFARAY